MKSYILIITCAFVLFCSTAHAQGIGINATAAPADSNAMLDVNSTTQGFLPPRLSAAQRANLATHINTAQKGMEVADATSGKRYYWDGTKWNPDKLYTGTSPIAVVASTNKIGFNPGTAAGDLITWDGNNWISTQPNSSFTVTTENRQPLLAINYCIALQGIFPSRNSEPFLGELELYAFSYAPNGFALCNGQLLPINQNQALFALLGTYYGGNGQTTFALPDLRSRVPVSKGQGSGLSTYEVGDKGGTENATIVH